MNFDLIKEVVELVQQFMEQNEGKTLYSNDLQGFTEWISASSKSDAEPKIRIGQVRHQEEVLTVSSILYW
jgi:hypothetical protein